METFLLLMVTATVELLDLMRMVNTFLNGGKILMVGLFRKNIRLTHCNLKLRHLRLFSLDSFHPLQW